MISGDMSNILESPSHLYFPNIFGSSSYIQIKQQYNSKQSYVHTFAQTPTHFISADNETSGKAIETTRYRHRHDRTRETNPGVKKLRWNFQEDVINILIRCYGQKVFMFIFSRQRLLDLKSAHSEISFFFSISSYITLCY